ncbi:MAG: SIS domain-containing protein [Solirubrobacterales bacterium]
MDKQDRTNNHPLNELQKEELAAKARQLFETSIEVKKQVAESHLEVIVAMAGILRDTLLSGGKILICGNGGSAADAQHLAAELVVRLRPHVNRAGLPAIALAGDPSSITACGNDYSFEAYYERMTRTFGRPGDVLLGISTSGKSVNVIRALMAAREIGMTALGFLGGDGGPALVACDLALVVPSAETGRIQESHITAGHALMELVEDLLLEAGYLVQE